MCRKLALQDLEKQSVKVTLKTKITVGSESEAYELITFGTKFQKNSSFYLQYAEESEAGKIQTTVKNKDNEILLLRNGAVKMRQLFREGETTNGHYESMYGMLPLLTKTKSAHHQWNDMTKEGRFDISYRMQMQGAEPGQYELTLTYKEEA
ncbi:hypothetical protein AC625_22715 [Peribacillus loiseleuriae]|uniref:DUF1934 domain-containing protein n=1 Tax=Peribacillus loiseleuriae TaxID=1679170 RepID=A0A0K9GZI2_9BACI|nr:hypothetical protein AC625_22715 [Peribacillus loiseleuriae]